MQFLPFVPSSGCGRIVPALAAGFALAVCSVFAAGDRVVIYNASPGGIMAAVAAARVGAEVVLVEPTQHIGGIMAQGGLVLSDLGDDATIGGLGKDFFARIERHYAETYGSTSSQRDHTTFQGCPGGRFEPRVAEQVFEDYLKQSDKTRLVRCAMLVRVEKELANITAIVVRDASGAETRIPGAIFMDATYTGDLYAMAGVSYHIGREANGDSGEPMARDAGDSAIQAYNNRVTLTDDPQNRVPIEKPAGYHPERYACHLKSILQNKPYRLTNIFRPYWRLPNRKQDTNLADLAGENHDYPLVDAARRAEIEREHRNYSLGYLYFIQNAPRVPEEIRIPAREWGLPAGEFADNGHFPRQLYVHEARRMRGEYVMRQQDLQEDRRKPNGIALGSYAIDSHAVKTYRDKDGEIKRDGYLFNPVKPYAIPYRAMLPLRAEAENLLVPVAMSSTYIA